MITFGGVINYFTIYCNYTIHSTMKKSIIAVIAGIVVGVIVTMLFDGLNHMIYPPPADFDPTDLDSYGALVAQMPTAALVMMVVGWLLTAFLGGMTAAYLDRVNWKRNAMIVGAALMIAALVNLYLIPHPVWMWVVSFLGYIPAAYLGGRLIAQRKVA